MSVTLTTVKHCPKCHLGIRAKGRFCFHCGDWCRCKKPVPVVDGDVAS